MRAVRCNSFGAFEDLVIEDLPAAAAGVGQIVISIRAAGVNYPDALQVQGKHQSRPHLPFTPGNELAGLVKEVGPGVSGLTVGQAVYGSSQLGAFAEEIAIDARMIQVIPEGVSFESAAVLPVTYGTSYYALINLAHLCAGETVLVLGASGGIGLAAIEVAKSIGARVIAAASSEKKLELCEAAGADEFVNYNTQNFRSRLKELAAKTDGVDVVLDPVGGPCAEPALRALSWSGRYLVVGFASGEIPRIPLNLVLLKGSSVIGVFISEAWTRFPELRRQNDLAIAQLAQAQKIRPTITARYSLQSVAEALDALVARRASGKLVLVP